ncbi:DNA-binding response OmpR family regulator [Mycetocola sp. BIGb0189]|uniref:response regulator transcription factor n=1 Tax=Mycetocola sp. BIGb0189 TaxID=2940604 RepID=UPI002166D7CE|nr:response regulator transcription factor [Mycetocola sp. BIGb0189]MCS4276410.1 DNA-binding response OmpR family regulator [Mycetocola sp. BIGb0189]
MESKPRVMLIEDDPTVRTVVADFLRAAGLDLSEYGDGNTAAAAVRERIPDLLIVDRMLPGKSGDELCREVRGYSDVPIMMLTALSAVDQRIEGLEHGADDYVAKPFSLRELQLRAEALLRRRATVGAAAMIVHGDFRIDPVHRRAWAHEREITLTAREYELFLYLLANPGRDIGRDELLREVWGWGFGDPSTVTVHVRRLREKIEPDPRFPCHLKTVWGAGYRFFVEASC